MDWDLKYLTIGQFPKACLWVWVKEPFFHFRIFLKFYYTLVFMFGMFWKSYYRFFHFGMIWEFDYTLFFILGCFGNLIIRLFSFLECFGNLIIRFFLHFGMFWKFDYTPPERLRNWPAPLGAYKPLHQESLRRPAHLPTIFRNYKITTKKCI